MGSRAASAVAPAPAKVARLVRPFFGSEARSASIPSRTVSTVPGKHMAAPSFSQFLGGQDRPRPSYQSSIDRLISVTSASIAAIPSARATETRWCPSSTK